MSIQPDQAGEPEWDIADRLRKGLRHAGIGVAEMADYLGVSRTSVSNWINGRIEPGTQTLRLWALRCGIDFNWLHHGTKAPCFGHGNPVSAGQRKVITGSYSNPVTFATPVQPFLPLAA